MNGAFWAGGVTLKPFFARLYGFWRVLKDFVVLLNGFLIANRAIFDWRRMFVGCALMTSAHMTRCFGVTLSPSVCALRAVGVTTKPSFCGLIAIWVAASPYFGR